ncbi:AMP-binding protein [Larkinella knui]|uniref:AMP-dependent synthetase n=1 Tax=Larkinella knui TaxID=2025310 RepID=A0A3P1CEW3_9BACT|nr:AMP-binding protein [Larkinella knui]RRB11798.1 AMP-dependent synthetase [Larkinella knui]
MNTLRSDFQKGQTLLDYFYYWEKQQPNKVYLRQPQGGRYRDFTWCEVGRQARTLATYLNSLGLPAKSNIGLVSKNCAHWVIADLAILLSGHVSVPFYPTLTASQLQQVLDHSQCQALFVGKLDKWQEMKSGVPKTVPCIDFPPQQPVLGLPDATHAQWEDILARYEPMTDNPQPHSEDLFTIVYTSGTTGNPKGVMMPYKAMISAIDSTKPLMCVDVPDPRFFSYLPLCHVAERNLVEALSLITGGTVYFVESMATFAKNLAAARPTHFLGVPRIWLKFQQTILARMPQRKLDQLLKIPLLSGIVKRELRMALGLNDARLILTGAAPTPVPLIRWFRQLGINIQEAYGMTENLGVVSVMPANTIKDGTVGMLYSGIQVKFDAVTGELMTRSDWTMRGYFREPEMTAAALDSEGWLHTGDVGTLDDEGFLTITGRMKEIYKTTKGEFVAPAQIESGFSENNFVDQICVAVHQLPQPIALIMLSETGLKADKVEVSQSLEETLNSLNPNLHTYQRVKKAVIVKDPWTVDNDMMTPSLKIKRKIIESRYESHLQPWLEREETVIWEG